jgi:ABC-type bacteriocin/lantibiotic exporter with double-glycine peptidase domain
VLTSAFVESLFDGLMMILTLVMMFIYSPQLAWIAIVAVGLYLAAAPALVQAAVPGHRRADRARRPLSTHYLETIRGMRAIKLFGRQLVRRNAWQTLAGQRDQCHAAHPEAAHPTMGWPNPSSAARFNILMLWTGRNTDSRGQPERGHADGLPGVPQPV